MSLKPSSIQEPSKKKSKRERDRENTRLYNSAIPGIKRVEREEIKPRNCVVGEASRASRNLGQYGYSSYLRETGDDTRIDQKENLSKKRLFTRTELDLYKSRLRGLHESQKMMEEAAIEAARRKKEEKIENLKQFRREVAFQRKYSPYISQRCCHNHSISNKSNGNVDLPVALEIREDDAVITGLVTCKSPTCRHLSCSWSKTIQRAKRIEKGIKGFLHQAEFEGTGHSVWFITLTGRRHHEVDHPKLRMRKGWKSIQNHNNNRSNEYSYHTVRGLDYTFKPFLRDVYHLHIHAIFVFDDNPTKAEVMRRVVDPWVRGMGGSALGSCQDIKRIYYQGEEPGDDAGITKVSRYIAKGTCMGIEVSGSSTMKTGNKGISFKELLTEATNNGGRYTEVYQEFLTEIKGSNPLTFSAEWPKLEEEEEAVEEEESKLRIEIPPYWQRTVIRNQSVVTVIMYSAYLNNKFYIIRDFKRMMACKNVKEVNRLCEEIGFSPHYFCGSKQYLWETWWQASRMVLKLEDFFVPKDEMRVFSPQKSSYRKPLFSCHNA